LANKLNIPTLVDPKNSYLIYKNCKIIKANKNDAEKFSNITINNIDDAYNASDYFILLTIGTKFHLNNTVFLIDSIEESILFDFTKCFAKKTKSQRI
jgi:bifunctional ADP-heptose synthase (sugar kinase/adenylyltransferase)